MIYFDNAATTYPKPDCVYKAINDGMKKYSFNAGRGSYKESTETFKMIEETRKLISEYSNSSKDNVIFTSSATESLNLIIGGLNLTEKDYVYVSPFEHNAIIRTLNLYKANVEIIPFDEKTWELKSDKLNDMFVFKKPKAVIISHISNVTGYMLPYEKIFALSKKYGAVNILDSAQGFGIYKINETNTDYIVFAGHKSLYAMFGIAGFIKYSNYDLNIVKAGGTGSDSLNINMPNNSPGKYEAGSLNSVGIYSIKESLQFLRNADFAEIENDLMKYLIEQLKTIKRIKIFLPSGYLPHSIISVAIEGFSSDDIGMILSDEYGICVRTGYHCAPYIHDFIDSKKNNGTVRISLSGFNTKDEIDKLINALKEISE